MDDKEDLIIRIQQMEQYMDEVFAAWKTSPKEIKENTELCEKIAVLTDYMDNGQWQKDYEADERGELPADLKRGVLSEDGLYNLLCDIEEYNRRDAMDFSINEMQQMQKKLQNHYSTIWEPIGPETGKNRNIPKNLKEI